jgi:hypothetical protein
MIILEKPYVSAILIEMLERLQVPVLRNSMSEEVARDHDIRLVDEDSFISHFRNSERPLLYSNSEDAIGWMEDKLDFSSLPRMIELCKDKVSYRKLLQDEYPDFFFASVDFDALPDLDTSTLAKPFIIKPAVGFFSLGVYRVDSDAEWKDVLSNIQRDVERVRGMYPREVLDTNRFIIEELIEGDEYAVDLYYDAEGDPVILNILYHIFKSDADMSDRTYVTSQEVIERCHDIFESSLRKFGELAGLKNVPMHVEYRMENGVLVPIEANPMRFAAWCTTDIGVHAWGINTVEYFLEGKKPDWKKIFSTREGKVYPLNVALVPEDIDIEDIKDIDYEGFASNYKNLLEMRRMDYRKYRVFAFTFSETDENNRSEIDRMLRADMHPYIVT